MKLVAVPIYMVVLVLGVAWQHADAAGVLAGVAREEFALPKGVPLAGYSRRGGKPSLGIHDPVGVRALVVTDADTTAAVVSCDLLIIDEFLFESVRRSLLAEGLPQDLILLLAATHTHSGPGAYGKKFFEKVSMGHFDPAVFDVLVHTITRTIARAYHERQPIWIALGTAQMAELVANRMDPHGVVDGELVVLAFYPQQQTRPLAVIVNFSAHPTTLGAKNRFLSADYPGVVVREVERRMPETIGFFFAGAVGDQTPRTEGQQFERMEAIGVPLAQKAEELLQHVDPQPATTLEAIQERLPLPPAQVRLGRLRLPRWLGQRFVDDDATLSVLRVGDTVLFGVPCDLAASLGLALKQAALAKNLQPVIVGFASDYIGYCVPASVYAQKQYESSMAFNGPGAGELVVERLMQMLDELQ